MFKGLRDRRVVLTSTTGEMFRGTVSGSGLFYVRLAAVEFSAGGEWTATAGPVRFPVRHVVYVQEL